MDLLLKSLTNDKVAETSGRARVKKHSPFRTSVSDGVQEPDDAAMLAVMGYQRLAVERVNQA
jgi:hypothetical protein